MNIYEIVDEYKALQEMAESGEYDEDVIKDTIESVEFELEAKAEGFGYFMRNVQAQINALKAEEKNLAEKRRVLENTLKKSMDTLQRAMEETGKTKFKSGIFSFAIQKNGGKAPVVLDTEVEELFANEDTRQFVKVTLEPDKDAMRKFLEKNGSNVATGDNGYLFHVGERGKSLRIR